MPKQLTSSFLDEVLKLGFSKKSVLEILRQHLMFSYIPKELSEYKYILKSMITQFDINNKLPSYGIISQQYQSNAEVQNALAKIKNADIIDTELALKQLDGFIKDIKFQFLFEDVYKTYNEDKKDEALSLFVAGAEELAKFSLKADTSQFLRVFGDFETNLKEKQMAKEQGEHIKSKVPFGIDILDSLTDGGMDVGDTALMIMRSGVGKSTFLKWCGMYACRLGYDVLHFQLEGSKQEAYDKYNQIWTGTEYREMKWGDIPADKMNKIQATLRDMLIKKRDLSVFSFEKYGVASMIEIRAIIFEYEKIFGKFPDFIIIDSLDLAITGENKKIDFDPVYKKDRLQTVAQRMKDIAVEIKSRILTATQTGSIPKEKWNNPDWVITREHTEGDRTLVKPFAHVFSGNITEDETKKRLCRIYIDKFRYYDAKDKIYPIYTAFNVGKFYDRNKTLRDLNYVYEGR